MVSECIRLCMLVWVVDVVIMCGLGWVVSSELMYMMVVLLCCVFMVCSCGRKVCVG